MKEFERITYTPHERAVSAAIWLKFDAFASELALTLPTCAEMTLCKRALQEALHWWECAHTAHIKATREEK